MSPNTLRSVLRFAWWALLAVLLLAMLGVKSKSLSSDLGFVIALWIAGGIAFALSVKSDAPFERQLKWVIGSAAVCALLSFGSGSVDFAGEEVPRETIGASSGARAFSVFMRVALGALGGMWVAGKVKAYEVRR